MSTSEPPSVAKAPGWPSLTTSRIALMLGALAAVAGLVTIADPGITTDEIIDADVGRDYLRRVGRLIDTAEARGVDGLGPWPLDSIFRDNAQHPPLGRWLVGIASALGEPFEPWLGGTDPFSVHPARLAPVFAFAGLVWLISWYAGRRLGRVAGLAAGFSLLVMPRSFAHAHFATLDTILSLTWTLALLGADGATRSERPLRAMSGAGALWGLALLTKIHAWFLPPLVAGLSLLRLGWKRAAGGMVAWVVAGLATYLLGWPWLWHDTARRLSGYLGTGVERLPLKVQYFGQVYLDREVPWHFPWYQFVASLPAGVLAYGLIGVAVGWRMRRTELLPLLLLASVLEFLVLFSTGIPVYDNERLFLHVFPAWAMLAGLGFQAAWDWFSRPAARLVLGVALVAQAYGVVAMHPFQLSYTSALLGGVAGAERRGMEVTYWGDAVDRVLLDELAARAAEGDLVVYAPTLHHMQATAQLTEPLFAKKVRFADATALVDGQTPAWLVVSRRTPYLAALVLEAMARGEVVAERSRSGVWLARLYRLR